jgi:aspartate aminotransferase
VPDDEAFVRLLSDLGVIVMPGRIFETPGFFRVSLTQTLPVMEQSLPRFATALTQARGT